jgi:large subunit ribosomal protein L18
VSLERKIKQRTQRRLMRVRQHVKKGELPRISVFRSLKHIYAQIIDDNASKTLISCSSKELKELTGDKKAVAQAVGKELAARAIKQGILKAAFDRGPFLFHGRVKALAEGVKEGGLII